MNIRHLGIFATDEEISSIRAAQTRPIMGMTNPEPPGPGVSPVVDMFEHPIKIVHRAALAHGLPEIPGYYGLNLETKEFLVDDSPETVGDVKIP